MSLLRIRRERKEESMGPVRPPRITKLLIGLAIVLLAIWYLSGLT
jgi:hypothetical protein